MRFSVEQFDTNTRWFIAQSNARMPFFMAGAFGEGNPSFLFAQNQQLDLSFVLFPLPGFCSSQRVAEIEKLTAVEKAAFNPFALDQRVGMVQAARTEYLDAGFFHLFAFPILVKAICAQEAPEHPWASGRLRRTAADRVVCFNACLRVFFAFAFLNRCRPKATKRAQWRVLQIGKGVQLK